MQPVVAALSSVTTGATRAVVIRCNAPNIHWSALVPISNLLAMQAVQSHEMAVID